MSSHPEPTKPAQPSRLRLVTGVTILLVSYMALQLGAAWFGGRI